MKNFLFLVCFVGCHTSCKKEVMQEEQQRVAQTIINVAYGSDAAQKMDIYLPAGRTKNSTKVIIMVPGGAWSNGVSIKLKRL